MLSFQLFSALGTDCTDTSIQRQQTLCSALVSNIANITCINTKHVSVHISHVSPKLNVLTQQICSE